MAASLPAKLRSFNRVSNSVTASRDVPSCARNAMTKRSKHSFASKDVAEQFRQKHGGEFGDFNEAIKQSYLDMAGDVAMIRKNREERRQKMMMPKQG